MDQRAVEHAAEQTAQRLSQQARERFPPTGRGTLVLLVSAAALWLYGYGAMDLVVFVLGVAGLVLVALCSLLAGCGALYLRRRLRTAPDELGVVPRVAVRDLEAGARVETGFASPAGWLSRLPLVKVAWSWAEPEGVECRIRDDGGRLVEEIVPRRRCEVQQLRRIFVVYDVFGMAHVSWPHTVPIRLTVLPDPMRLRQAAVVPSFAAAEGIPHPRGAPEGDRMEIRRYVAGDSARDILWKSYARTRQLNVRRPERSIDRQTRTVAYLAAGPDDEAAAAAARVALETGALGRRWRFGADGTPGATDHLNEALHAVARSASGSDARARVGRGLAAFLREMAREGDAHCVVFVPGRAGAWSQHVLEAAARYGGGALSFVVGAENVSRVALTREPIWQRWLLARDSDATQAMAVEDVEALARSLAARAAGVSVVDRASGRSWRFEGKEGLAWALP